jgi:hypothetical protein
MNDLNIAEEVNRLYAGSCEADESMARKLTANDIRRVRPVVAQYEHAGEDACWAPVGRLLKCGEQIAFAIVARILS